jgi:hypothetical protein
VSTYDWRLMMQASTRYNPTDESSLSREARKLRDQGLTERDVGAALRLDPTAVRRMLEGL